MRERLQKIISARGIASRRKAEQMIEGGRVSCNGIVCHLGDSADPETDVILLDGKPLPTGGEATYIMLNKPTGYVTTLSDEKNRPNVAQLVADCGTRVYPVGRLDMDSEGLLLLTNDGEFANFMSHPRHMVEKCYRVWVKNCTPEAVEKLKLPVVLDDYQIQPPVVSIVDESGVLDIIIHEGRNRQVRRMCALAGMEVLRLRRISEGALQLGSLPKGKWRLLTKEELALLGWNK